MSIDPFESHLNPADAEALDALVAAGFDCSAVPVLLRARARRLADLLRLLDGPAPLSAADLEARAGLVDATMARALAAPIVTAPSPELSSLPEPEATLCDADADALDALIGAGWKASDVPRVHAARAARLSALLAPLDAAELVSQTDDAYAREDLIAATMDAVRRDSIRARTLSAHELRPGAGRRSGFRLADLVSIAACLLIGASIIWPTLASGRAAARQAACANNMQNAGLGFSLYAGDNRGELPRAASSLAGMGGPDSQWWNVGDPKHSHSANVFVLITSGHASLTDLTCPGNPNAPSNLDLATHQDWRSPEEVSFSYQLFGRERASWRGPARRVVLTDKSPVIERARRAEHLDPDARSLNHRGAGQHALFNDGSVQWLTRPVLENGDNIWLPKSRTGKPDATLRGTERPDSPDDAFVGP